MFGLVWFDTSNFRLLRVSALHFICACACKHFWGAFTLMLQGMLAISITLACFLYARCCIVVIFARTKNLFFISVTGFCCSNGLNHNNNNNKIIYLQFILSAHRTAKPIVMILWLEHIYIPLHFMKSLHHGYNRLAINWERMPLYIFDDYYYWIYWPPT